MFTRIKLKNESHKYNYCNNNNGKNLEKLAK